MRAFLLFLFFQSILICNAQNSDFNNFIETPQPESLPKDIKPLRLGIRAGVPHLATFNLEFLTPLFDDRIALTTDYFGLSRKFDDGIFRFSNFEIGTNVYFKNTGSGFYGSLTYFTFRSGVGFEDHKFYENYRSDGKADFNFNTFNIKLGYKTGRTIYFRVEAGYGFGKIPDDVIVRSTTYNVSIKEDVPDVPGISSSDILIFNIGVGASFF